MSLKRLLLVLITTSFLSCRQAQGTSSSEEKELIDWIRQRGGFVDERQEIRNDPETGVRGVFVNRHVKEGELLLSLPWELLVSPDTVGAHSFCDTVQVTKREIQLGQASHFAPHANILHNTRDELPDWSQAGKELLQQIVGRNLPPHPQRLAPHLKSWTQNCGDDPEKDPDGTHAAFLALTRAHTVPDVDGNQYNGKSCMVPFYDLLNHRRGVWHNAKALSVVGGHFKIIASKDIVAGGQVYNSYETTRDTSVVFNNWGFVEQYPHRWTFERTDRSGSKRQIDFLVDRHASSLESELLPQATWLSGEPSRDDISFLQRELDRLNLLSRRKNHIVSGVLTDNEQRKIWQYHAALTFAIERAIEAGNRNDQAKESFMFTFTLVAVLMGVLGVCVDFQKKGKKGAKNLTRIHAKRKLKC